MNIMHSLNSLMDLSKQVHEPEDGKAFNMRKGKTISFQVKRFSPYSRDYICLLCILPSIVLGYLTHFIIDHCCSARRPEPPAGGTQAPVSS